VITVGRMPIAGDIRVHRRCYDSWHREGQERAAAWSKSPRGRLTLAALWLRLGGLVVVASLTSLALWLPMSVYRLVQRMRLRRRAASVIGEREGLLVFAYRAGSTAADEGLLPCRDWAATHDVVVRELNLSERTNGSLEAELWSHWRPAEKLERGGLLYIPRRGRVEARAFSFSAAPEDVVDSFLSAIAERLGRRTP
jgi:hypothetical protein